MLTLFELELVIIRLDGQESSAAHKIQQSEAYIVPMNDEESEH